MHRTLFLLFRFFPLPCFHCRLTSVLLMLCVCFFFAWSLNVFLVLFVWVVVRERGKAGGWLVLLFFLREGGGWCVVSARVCVCVISRHETTTTMTIRVCACARPEMKGLPASSRWKKITRPTCAHALIPSLSIHPPHTHPSAFSSLHPSLKIFFQRLIDVLVHVVVPRLRPRADGLHDHALDLRLRLRPGRLAAQGQALLVH
jgi:hypothetical protein